MDSEESLLSPNVNVDRPLSSLSSTPSVSRSSSKKRPRSSQQKKDDLIDLAYQTLSKTSEPESRRPPEDKFDIYGKKIAYDMRDIDRRQQIIAEKLINDVLYYAKLGSLTASASVTTSQSVTQPFHLNYMSQPQPLHHLERYEAPGYSNDGRNQQAKKNSQELPEISEYLTFNLNK